MTEQRAAVIREAESWLGTRYMQGQCIKGIGIDCGRFLCAVYRVAGVKTPEIGGLPHFPRDWHLHANEESYLEIIQAFAREVATPEPGDAALIRVGRVFGHSAIVTAWPRVIHVYWEAGVELADMTKAPLAGRPVRYFSPWP